MYLVHEIEIELNQINFLFTEKHDALCLLALNIISEKIFVFLWFWLIIIAIATALYIVYQIGVVMIPGMRKFMLEKERKRDSGLISMLMKKADIGDWFVIFLISKNLDSIMFNEFLTQLTEELKTKVHDWDELIWDTDPSQVLLQVNEYIYLNILSRVIWLNLIW